MKYEFKKLFSNRLFVLTLLVLLCANCVTAYVSAPDDKEWNSALAAFFEDYSASPEEYDKRYWEYKTARDAIIDKQIQAVLNGEDPEKYVFTEPCTLYPDSGFTDGEFYAALYERKEYPAFYLETVRNILAENEKNLSVVTDPFMKDYLNQVKSAYMPLTELQLSVNMVSGWEEFFGYKTTAVFCMFVVITAAFVIANIDRDQRLEAILFSAKKGSGYIICQKLSVLVLVCALTVVLFDLTAFSAFALKTGFAGHGEFLASLDVYKLCPYPVYIYEYAFIRAAVRFAALLFLGTLFIAASRVIKNIFGVFVFGAGFIGVNSILNSIQPVSAGSPLQTLNIFKLSDADSIFLKYAGVDIFNRSLPLYVFYSFLFVISISVLVIFIFFVWRKSKRDIAGKRFSVTMPRCTPRTLFGFEIKKLFRQSAVGFPVLAIIICKVLLCLFNAGRSVPYTEELYKSYMHTLEGEYTESTRRYLAEERARFERIFDTETRLAGEYENGDIDFGEYYAAKLTAQAETKKYEAFCRAEAEVERIAELNKQGVSAYIVYETGWNKLLFSSPDILLTLLALVPAFAFYADDKAGLRSICNTAAKGGNAALIRKTAVCAVFVVLCCFVFFALDVISVNCLYGLPYPDASDVSLQAFAQSKGHISIGSIAVFLPLYRAFLSVLLAVIAVGLSAVIRVPSVPPILFGGAVLLPWLLSTVTYGGFKYISVVHLYTLTALTDIGMLPLAVVVLITATALYIKAYFNVSKPQRI